jgi:hypothetical protein
MPAEVCAGPWPVRRGRTGESTGKLEERSMAPDRPEELDTARLADLPVEEGLPPEAPDRAHAAVDDLPEDLDPEAVAHEATASRDPRAVMASYASALATGDAALAAGLFAENGLLVAPAARSQEERTGTAT